jgi:hypothetical protein
LLLDWALSRLGPINCLLLVGKIVSKEESSPKIGNRYRWRLFAFRGRTVTQFGVVILLMCALVAVKVGFSQTRGIVTLAVGDPSSQTTNAEPSEDQRLRRLAIGTWKDFHHGKRTLTLNEDGTATMVLKLTGMKALMFTPRLQLDIVWSIKDGKMHRRTVGGKPASKVAFVNKQAGVSVAEPIRDLTDKRMILVDKNGSQEYTWRRVK